MPAFLSRWLSRILKTEGAISFADYVYKFALSVGGAGLMGALLRNLEWYWETFEWAGVFGGALITWFLIAVGLYLFSSRNVKSDNASDKHIVENQMDLQEINRMETIGKWQYMLDEFNEKYHAPNDFGPMIEELKERPEYGDLQDHLSHETLQIISQYSGIYIKPSMKIAGEDNETKQLIGLLRRDITRVKKVWGLL